MMLGSEDYRYFMQVMQVSQGLSIKAGVSGWGSPAVVSLFVCWCACCSGEHPVGRAPVLQRGHLQAGLSGPRADCAACGFACVPSQAAAERHCQGRVVAVHEGGYSELYVPFCGLAVIEQLARTRSKVRRLTCASCLL